MEVLRETLPEHRMKETIMMKLGAGPFQYLKTRPFIEDTAGMLRALTEEYDPLGDPKSASVQFHQLHQGTKSLSEHHNTVYTLLKGMGKTCDTRDVSLLTMYIKSLTAVQVRESLFRMWDGQGNKSLAEMMQVAKDGERTRVLARGLAQEPEIARAAVVRPKAERITPQTAPPENDSDDDEDHQLRFFPPHIDDTVLINAVARVKTKAQSLTSPFGTKDWCPIHQSVMHSHKDCRLRNAKSCRLCQADVPEGGLLDHILKGECKAPLCFTCQRLGHKSNECYTTHKHLRPNKRPNTSRANPTHAKARKAATGVTVIDEISETLEADLAAAEPTDHDDSTD